MNKGGRPLGSASLQKRIEEQKKDEEAHPEKRDQKHEQRLNFFTPGFFVRQRPVQSMKPHGWEGGIDRALESEGRRDDGPPLSTTANPLPVSLAEREEGVVYRYSFQGVLRLVKWCNRHLLCMCSETSDCRGGRRLEGCKTSFECRPASGSAMSEVSDSLDRLEQLPSPRPPAHDPRASSAIGNKLFKMQEEFFSSVTSIPSQVETRASALVILNNGTWGKELLLHERWSASTQDVKFPLRLGLQWRKEFGGRHAQVVDKSFVNVMFEIVQQAGHPERPSFRIRDFDIGPLAATFSSQDVHDLERKWLLQSNNTSVFSEKLQGTTMRGTTFTGFNNLYFAQHLLDVTPEFEGGRRQRTRLPSKDVVTDRMNRKRCATMMEGLHSVLELGGTDEESAFLSLIKSRPFKAKFGDLLQYEFGNEVTAGLVEDYKAAIVRKDCKQARTILSLYAPSHSRFQTQTVFGCSERQVKSAVLTYRLKDVPRVTIPATHFGTFDKDTVTHFEGKASRADNVERSPSSQDVVEAHRKGSST
jgi:hypothetical protein